MPAVEGATYKPVLLTVPPVADQASAVLAAPLTKAVNCCVAPVWSEAELGLILTETGAETVTVADATFVGSATLVADTL